MNNTVNLLNREYNINTKELDLEWKGMYYVPEDICYFTKLERLFLDNNDLGLGDAYDEEEGVFPDCFKNLKNLKELVLNSNKFSTFPEKLYKIPNLRYLYLKNNKIRKLPNDIGKLKNLKVIDLDGNGNELTPEGIPQSIKKLPKTVKIYYNNIIFNGGEHFYYYFNPVKRPNIRKRVSKNTELFNSAFSNTNKISQIPVKRRAYINIPSNVKNNGELRRLYNKKGLNSYMRGRETGRLHGNNFMSNNIKILNKRNVVNKNVYLRNIRHRLLNSSLTNFFDIVKQTKNNLPSNVSRNDVNDIVRKMKPKILNKIYNKLKNSPSNRRAGIMNSMKNKGFLNNNDIVNMKKKLSS